VSSSATATSTRTASFSVFISNCNINKNCKLQCLHQQLQHQQELQAVAGKTGGQYFSPLLSFL
jgi:hypothetical protein